MRLLPMSMSERSRVSIAGAGADDSGLLTLRAADVLAAAGIPFEIVSTGRNSPLAGKSILVTRPARDGQAIASALCARGIIPVLAPTISIGPPDDLHRAHHAIDELANYAWIVFTSRHGVDAFFERLSSLDADARYLGAVRVAAIGSKTAASLREHGVRADLVPHAFIGEEIARALIEATPDGERILIYRAQEGRDVLPQMLEEAGRRAHVVAAYKTSFVEDPDFALKAARAEVLTFTSASTLKGFAHLLGGPDEAARCARGKLVACIGPVTAQMASELGIQVDVVADTFTADGLLDALESHLSRCTER